MEDTWTKALLALLPVLVGAGIGIVPTLLLERFKTQAALRTRWDQTRQTTCAQLAACVRRIVDVAEEPGDHAEELDGEHRQLQIHMAEIRIVGGFEVQATARSLVGTTFALQKTAGTAEAVQARKRTLTALFEFYRAVRRELQVPEADELAPMNPPPSPEVVHP
jgi:hypothetical protein